MLGIRKSAKSIPRKPQDSLRSDSDFFRRITQISEYQV